MTNNATKKTLENYAVASVKAFIEKDGKILILKESPQYQGGTNHGLFVLPGGKVAEGEHFREALSREIEEECGLTEVEIGQPFHTDEWFPDIPGKPKHIVGTYFRCKLLSGEPSLNPDFDSLEWIKPEEYVKYELNDAAQRAFASYLKIN